MAFFNILKSLKIGSQRLSHPTKLRVPFRVLVLYCSSQMLEKHVDGFLEQSLKIGTQRLNHPTELFQVPFQVLVLFGR